VVVSDPDGDEIVSWTGTCVVEASGTTGILNRLDNNDFEIGPIAYSSNHEQGSQITITVRVVDSAGNPATAITTMTLHPCIIIG